jgi:glycosyltransferase involved in cell wall biosynthesis
MRIALIHDWLLSLGGAEKVLMELHDMFPRAPIYTLCAKASFVTHSFPRADVITSSLQHVPGICARPRWFMPLMPMAVESFDFSQYDTVISSSAFFAHGIVIKPRTRHICYSYSPMRSLWDRNGEYRGGGLVRHILRMWDSQASARVDTYIAPSRHVSERIKKFYQRDAQVIYPPLIPCAPSHNAIVHQPGFFLIVSRLYTYKNIGVAIDAFNKLGYSLVVIGDGPERRRLERLAGPTISLIGYQDDATVAAYYRDCKAFIMPQEEDFGLTALEAMSYGKPVLALRRGGALETVHEGISGEFFNDPIPEVLADGVRRINERYDTYDPERIKASVQPFSRERFRSEIQALLS